MFFRILLWSLLIFFLVRFLWRILAPLFRSSATNHEGRDPVEGDSQERKRMEYKDVQDAKFHDLPTGEGGGTEGGGERAKD